MVAPRELHLKSDRSHDCCRVSPHPQVGLVTFASDCTLYGDGDGAEEVIAGDKLSDYNRLLEEGQTKGVLVRWLVFSSLSAVWKSRWGGGGGGGGWWAGDACGIVPRLPSTVILPKKNH